MRIRFMGGEHSLVMKVTSIPTDVAIPACKFEVPADIELTEV